MSIPKREIRNTHASTHDCAPCLLPTSSRPPVNPGREKPGKARQNVGNRSYVHTCSTAATESPPPMMVMQPFAVAAASVSATAKVPCVGWAEARWPVLQSRANRMSLDETTTKILRSQAIPPFGRACLGHRCKPSHAPAVSACAFMTMPNATTFPQLLPRTHPRRRCERERDKSSDKARLFRPDMEKKGQPVRQGGQRTRANFTNNSTAIPHIALLRIITPSL